MSVALEFPNLDAFAGQLAQWAEGVREQMAQAARGLALEALREITEQSPQYSGDFAANWKLSVGAPNFSFQGQLFSLTGGPRLMGDREAIEYAWANNQGALNGFRLGDTIYLANSAEHDQAYAWRIEDNKIKFRPGNKGAPLRNWYEKAQVVYRNLTPALIDKLVQQSRGLA